MKDQNQTPILLNDGGQQVVTSKEGHRFESRRELIDELVQSGFRDPETLEPIYDRTEFNGCSTVELVGILESCFSVRMKIEDVK